MAARVVCAARQPAPLVAVCLHGATAPPPLVLASVKHFVTGALGTDGPTLVVVDRVPTDPSWRDLLAADTDVVVTVADANASVARGDERRRCPHSAAFAERRRCLEALVNYEARARKSMEAVLIAPASHVWTRPLWPACWDLGLRAPTASGAGSNRYFAHARSPGVWWLHRSSADALLARMARREQQCEAPSAETNSESADGVRAESSFQQGASDSKAADSAALSQMLQAAREAHVPPPEIDLALSAAIPATMATAQGSSSAGGGATLPRADARLPPRHPAPRGGMCEPVFDCHAWESARPSHLLPNALAAIDSGSSVATSVLQISTHPARTDRAEGESSLATSSGYPRDSAQLRRLPCPMASACGEGSALPWSPPLAPAHIQHPASKVQSNDDKDEEVEEEVAHAATGSHARVDVLATRAARLATRAVCGDRPPRLAVCFGGLARTFGRALVHRSLKGHLIDALGARATVFAVLRLEDRRGIDHYQRTDLSGVVPASERDVRAALTALGAAEANVRLCEATARS